MSELQEKMNLPAIDSLVLVFANGDNPPQAGFVKGYMQTKEMIALSVQFGNTLCLVEPTSAVDLTELLKKKNSLNFMTYMGHA